MVLFESPQFAQLISTNGATIKPFENNPAKK
jgi:hypothetical protein